MSIVTKKTYHLSGLSTDTKPIPEDIATGSTYFETDTGVNFIFNRSLNQWIPTSEKIEPQVTAPCVGILSIELTSREGLVDTYTIRYTNGASTTFNVTNGEYIDPNIGIDSTLIDDKIYTIDLSTKSFNLYKLFEIEGSMEAEDTILTSLIDHTKFWPRVEESKFIVHADSDLDLLFNYTGTVATQDIWQAFMVDEENKFIRFVGHFEYENEDDKENSDFYFIATKQTIDFVNLRVDLDQEVQDRIDAVTAEETRATDIEAGLRADLTDEINTARQAEQDLNDKINALDLAEVGQDGSYLKTVSQEDGQLSATSQVFDTDFTTPTDNNAPTTQAVKTYVDNAIDSLDKAEEGADGYYIKKVKEDNGVITVTKQQFDQNVSASATHDNVPSTKAVWDIIDSLDVESVGSDGSYLKTISEANGKISTTKQAFDTEIPATNANPSNINAPTTKAVRDAINTLDVESVGSNGGYIKTISETDGKISATRQAFDLEVNSASTDDNTPTSKAVNTAITTAINALDVQSVGSDGGYLKTIEEVDGKISATRQPFDTAMTGATDKNAPTTKTVKDYVDQEAATARQAEQALDTKINNLDLNIVGDDGKYVKFVSQTNGQVSATAANFDTAIPAADPSEITAPTTKAVKTYVDSKSSEDATDALNAAKAYTNDQINSLDSSVGDGTKILTRVDETNGKLTSCTERTILTTIDDSTNIPNAHAVKDYVEARETAANTYTDNKVQAEIEKLYSTTGASTKLISTITETDGKLTGYTGPDILAAVNDSTDIPTAHAVKTYADNINTDLQNQINDLKYVQNVVEVVGTKALLNALPKADYDPGDKVQVIADESLTDAPTSVYALNSAKNAWDYVGAYGGNSYTKTEADARFVNRSVQVNGHALTSNISISQSDVGLGNVDNKSEAQIKSDFTGQIAVNNTEFVTGGEVYTHTSATNNPHNVTKAQVGLGNVTDDKQIKGLASGTAENNILTFGNDGYTVKDSGKTFITTINDISTAADTKLPTEKAVRVELNKKEDVANKVSTFSQTPNNTNYPTEKLVKDNLDTKENISNKVASFSLTPTDTNYPTEKLVKDALDTKVDKVAGKGLSTNDFTNNYKQDLDDIITNGHIDVKYEQDGDTGLYEFNGEDIRKNKFLIVTLNTLVHDAGLDDAEHTANRVTSIIDWAADADLSDAKYPTEKLVKLSLNGKASLADNNTFNGENTFNDEVTVSDDFYVTGQSDFDNDMTVHGDVEITNDLTVDGGIAAGDLSATGSSITLGQSDGSVYIRGNTTISGSGDNDLDVNLATTFTEEVEFTGSVTYTETVASNITTSTSMADICNLIWNEKKPYNVGDIIFYNKALYICNLAISASSVGNMDPAADTTHWTKLFTNQA